MQTIQAIVDAHNNVRSNVKPTATDLPAMSWDVDLARLSQRQAETCLGSHEPSNQRTLVNQPSVTVGQNIYTTGRGYTNLTALWIDAVASWASEQDVYTYGVMPSNFAAVGHYTQLVNKKAVRVGCGAAKCGSTIYAYCDYAQGQMTNDLATPYQSGASASACGVAGSANNLCKCNLLCQNGGVLDAQNCRCNCPAYTTGTQCEALTCTLIKTKENIFYKNPFIKSTFKFQI